MTQEHRATVRYPSLGELSKGTSASSQSHAEAAGHPCGAESSTMTSPSSARRQLIAASGLLAGLKAAYDAFECLLTAFEDDDDPACSTFAAFVMSAALAADGRDAVAFAPSLPPAALDGRLPAMADGERASANELADLCCDVITLLERAAETASNPGDCVACRNAIRCALGIHVLLTGEP